MNAAFTGLRKKDGQTAVQNAEIAKYNNQETRADSIHGKREEKYVPVSQPEKDNRCVITTEEYPSYFSSFSRLLILLLTYELNA